MLNLSDKELDRLSREAADLYEPDESSLSWSRLEQRLSEQMPERPPDGFRFGRISPYLWGPAVAIIAGISFYLIKNNYYSQHSTLTNQAISEITPSDHSANKKAGANTVILDSSSSAEDAAHAGTDALHEVTGNSKNTGQGAVILPTGPSEKSTGIVVSTPGSGAEKSVLGSDASASGNSKDNLTTHGSAKKTNRSIGNIPGSLAAGGSFIAGSSVTTSAAANNLNSGGFSESSKAEGEEKNVSKNTTNAARNKNQLSLPQIIGSSAAPVVVKGNDSLLNKFSLSNSGKPEKSLHLNRSLNIGLTFGPDYTDAGGITNNQFGNNIGLTIGYYLTSRLSINTGAIYTNKFYWSEGKGYNQPQYASGSVNTYAASPAVELVNGSCNMWEIPLTLRYDFAQNRKSKFFANAGLSSYFMMKQSYIYFFHSGIRPLAWKTTNNEQQNYWFDVANISVGLENEIGKGFSFQVEPFLKLPLKNMGSENLKLNSYGVLLSFRYSPVLSRTKK